MNKSLLLGIVVIGLLLLGGVWYYWTAQQANAPTAEPTSLESQSEGEAMLDEGVAGVQSLNDLLAAAQDQQCIFRDTATSGGTAGTVYVGNGKLRGDFISTMNEQSTESHMITDAQEAFIWMEGSAEGFRVDVSAAAEVTPNQNDTTLDPNKKVNFECQPWDVDAALFTPPANVTFSDIGAMMQEQMLQASVPPVPAAGATAQQCAACDSAPEAARAQCRAALGC